MARVALAMLIEARETASTSPPTRNGSRMLLPLNCRANCGAFTTRPPLLCMFGRRDGMEFGGSGGRTRGKDESEQHCAPRRGYGGCRFEHKRQGGRGGRQPRGRAPNRQASDHSDGREHERL